MTSSPAFRPSAIVAKCSAAVQEVVTSACFTPWRSAISCSNFWLIGPCVTQPEFRQARNMSISASSNFGAVSCMTTSAKKRALAQRAGASRLGFSKVWRSSDCVSPKDIEVRSTGVGIRSLQRRRRTTVLIQVVIHAFIAFGQHVLGPPAARVLTADGADAGAFGRIDYQLPKHLIDGILRRVDYRALGDGADGGRTRRFDFVYPANDRPTKHHTFARSGSIAAIVELIDDDVCLRENPAVVDARHSRPEKQPYGMPLCLQ